MRIHEMPTAYALMMVRDALQQNKDLLYNIRIKMEDLESKEYLPFDDYLEILAKYNSWNDEPDWAFSFGDRLGIATHGALGFGAMSAKTVRDGLGILSRYLPTRACHTSSQLIEVDDAINVLFEFDTQVLPYPRQYCEILSMVFQTYIESVGASSAPTVWHFPYPEPDESHYYTRWLHGGFRFEAAQFMLEVPGSVCMIVSPFHNESIYRSSITECERILSERDEDQVVAMVRNYLSVAYESRISETEPGTVIPDAERVAKLMGISKRTLIRKLKEGGTTFMNVRDDLLREYARRLFCKDSSSLVDIGHRLGYQDAGNFTRACKRLFGESPTSLRQRLVLTQ